MKKIASFLLIVLLCVSFVGCGVMEEEGNDPNKTQLYIGNYDGGFKDEWLYEAKKRYEAKHPDVIVKINSDKSIYEEKNLLATMDTNQEDIYFLSSLTYDVFKSKLLDITDIVTEKSEDVRMINGVETKVSILDKMNPDIKGYYNLDGKYYGLPFTKSIFSSIYNVDLFESNYLYFQENGNFVTSSNKTKSLGLDGVVSYDDGLPKNYTEFRKLMTTLISKGIKPYTFSGGNAYYRMRLLASFWADAEGADNYNLNNTFAGSYTFSGDSKATDITLKNANLLQKQQGKLFALQFGRDLITNEWMYAPSLGTIHTHIEAQTSFLRGGINGAQKIAMLADGDWWENESKTYMNDLAVSQKDDSLKYGVRKFALMPAPKADGDKSVKHTFLANGGNSLACISNKTDKAVLAKDFLKFTTSDEMLKVFTTMTGAFRPYDYELSSEQYNNLSYFSKNCWDVMHEEGTETVYVDMAFNEEKRNNKSYFEPGWLWNSLVPPKGAGNNIVVSEPLLAFNDNASLTAQQYFDGLSLYYGDWDTRYGG